MQTPLSALQAFWIASNVPAAAPASSEEIVAFELNNKLVLPGDVKAYFSKLNGTCGDWDGQLLEFNSLAKFNSIDAELRHWGGIPDYTNIVNTLPGYNFCFVFADYCIQLMTYAIRLHPKGAAENDVYAICGNKYRVIARSFTSFIELYLSDSNDVML